SAIRPVRVARGRRQAQVVFQRHRAHPSGGDLGRAHNQVREKPRNTRNTRKKNTKNGLRNSDCPLTRIPSEESFLLFLFLFSCFSCVSWFLFFDARRRPVEPLYVVGAGGIGCAVGYVLYAAGVRVTFVDADPEKVRWGRSHGVCLDRRLPQPAEF